MRLRCPSRATSNRECIHSLGARLPHFSLRATGACHSAARHGTSMPAEPAPPAALHHTAALGGGCIGHGWGTRPAKPVVCVPLSQGLGLNAAEALRQVRGSASPPARSYTSTSASCMGWEASTGGGARLGRSGSSAAPSFIKRQATHSHRLSRRHTCSGTAARRHPRQRWLAAQRTRRRRRRRPSPTHRRKQRRQSRGRRLLSATSTSTCRCRPGRPTEIRLKRR